MHNEKPFKSKYVFSNEDIEHIIENLDNPILKEIFNERFIKKRTWLEVGFNVGISGSVAKQIFYKFCKKHNIEKANDELLNFKTGFKLDLITLKNKGGEENEI